MKTTAQTEQESATLHPPTEALGHDLRGLSHDIRALHADLQELAASDRLEQLLRLIPRPGWTTPAEFLLVRESVAQMRLQLQALERAQAGLLRGAELVGVRS